MHKFGKNVSSFLSFRASQRSSPRIRTANQSIKLTLYHSILRGPHIKQAHH